MFKNSPFHADATNRRPDPSPSPPESPPQGFSSSSHPPSSFFSSSRQARQNVYGRTGTVGGGDDAADATVMNLGVTSSSREQQGYGHPGVGGSVGSMASTVMSGDGWREAGGTANGGLGALGEGGGSRIELLIPDSQAGHTTSSSAVHSPSASSTFLSSPYRTAAPFALSSFAANPHQSSSTLFPSASSPLTSRSGVNQSITDSSTVSLADPYFWNLDELSAEKAEPDDWLHEQVPGQSEDRVGDGKHGGTVFTRRGIMNVGCLAILGAALLMLFAGYPILVEVQKQVLKANGSFNLGGVNGTGQVPAMGNFGLIDSDTPADAYTHTGYAGSNKGVSYELVFSDEFETDGRSFNDGDDPYWEAANLHYWATNNLEWYDPRAVTTANGSLVITLSKADDPATNHDLDYIGGMISTWNKFCFQEGYIETKVKLPGSPKVWGLWPAVWTLGNLGRAGYGGTLDGTWPYTYDSCDLGTLKNQTYDGLPEAALTTGAESYNYTLSYLPGQRLSACTCQSDPTHPGPRSKDGSFIGRGAPEIDIFEAQVDAETATGHVSMSGQWAPFDDHYQFKNTSSDYEIYNDELSHVNTYLGGITQQSTSVIVETNQECYEHPASGKKSAACWATYGFEYKTGNDGYISWLATDEPAWTVFQSAIGPNSATKVGTRVIPEEPMYLIVNLGISNNFGAIDWEELEALWPVKMEVEYIRVYQPAGSRRIGCDPADHPTAKYIAEHLDMYSNPNITTYAQGGYVEPLNSLGLKETGQSC